MCFSGGGGADQVCVCGLAVVEMSDVCVLIECPLGDLCLGVLANLPVVERKYFYPFKNANIFSPHHSQTCQYTQNTPETLKSFTKTTHCHHCQPTHKDPISPWPKHWRTDPISKQKITPFRVPLVRSQLLNFVLYCWNLATTFPEPTPQTTVSFCFCKCI